MRVYELARELNVESREVLRASVAIRLGLRSSSSTMTEQQVQTLREAIRNGLGASRPTSPWPGQGAESPSDWMDIVCECCDLPQRVKTIDGTPTMCGPCIEHRGADQRTEVRRAQEHEAMLRGRLKAARSAANEAYEARDNYKEKMHGAYRSREHAVRQLQQINDLHVQTPSGLCSCGKRQGCKTADIIYRPWCQDMIRRLDAADQQREADEEALVDPRKSDPYLAIWDQVVVDDGGAAESRWRGEFSA